MKTLLLIALAFAPTTETKAKITFYDNSHLYVDILEKHINVNTNYGALRVPVKDIVDVNFGLHYLPGEKEAITQSINKLKSTVYVEREKAFLFLKHKAQYALPLLDTQETDKESRAYTTKLLELTQFQVPDDVINSKDGSFKGVIVGKDLKVRHKHLGDFAVSLREIQSLYVFQGEQAFRVQWTSGNWKESTYQVRKGDTLSITAEGTIDMCTNTPGQYTSGPRGSTHVQGVPNNGFHAGALMGRIGNGIPFFIGDSYSKIQTESGRLQLVIVDTGWFNSPTEGQYTIKIRMR